MKTGDYVKAAGGILTSAFLLLIGLAATFVVAIVVIVSLLVKIYFFPSEKVAEPAPAALIEIEYPKVSGLCFRTPMGDVGKVIGQQKDMLEMTFRGGVKTTYRFDQVVHADCGVLPAP